MSKLTDALAALITGRRIFQDQDVVEAGSVAIDPDMPDFNTMAKGMITHNLVKQPVSDDVIYALQSLSVRDPLLSKVVYDNVTLANSPHTIFLEGESEAAVREAAESLNELLSGIHSGGLTGWYSVAFYQILVTGALSHEWVVRKDLQGLLRSHFVPVTSIRFGYDSEQKKTFPIQVKRTDGTRPILNELTYHYRPLLQIENIPYGIPPYAAAIKPLWVQENALDQIAGVSRKMGMLGIVQMLISPPKPLPGETTDQYKARASAQLTDAKDKMSKNFKDGLFIGFKDKHEFKIDQTTGDPRGFDTLWQAVDLQSHTATNTDPSMTGRPYSRTETQIRLVYEILTQQLGMTQRIVDSSVAAGLNLHLRLAGLNVTATIEREKISPFDMVREETAKFQRSTRILNELREGLITEEQAREELGYANELNAEQPGILRAAMVPHGTKYQLQIQQPKIAVYARDVTIPDVELHDCDWPLLDQGPDSGCCANHAHHQFASENTLLDKMVDDYVKAIMLTFPDTENNVMDIVNQWLRRNARETAPEQFADQLYRLIANEYGKEMTSNRVRAVVETNIEAIYQEARMGLGWAQAFEKITLPDGMDAIWDPARDGRTVAFLKETDFYYLGRYVKRNDTAERLKRKIRDEYIAVGRDFRDRKFIDGIARDIEVERWQAERIVRTTANTSRSFGQLRAYEQVGMSVVQKYEIVGPLDQVTCPYCADLMGRQFSVQLELNRMRSIISQGPQALPRNKPFATSKPLEDFQNASDSELQAEGLGLTPAHPNCRHRTVGVPLGE